MECKAAWSEIIKFQRNFECAWCWVRFWFWVAFIHKLPAALWVIVFVVVIVQLLLCQAVVWVVDSTVEQRPWSRQVSIPLVAPVLSYFKAAVWQNGSMRAVRRGYQIHRQTTAFKPKYIIKYTLIAWKVEVISQKFE